MRIRGRGREWKEGRGRGEETFPANDKIADPISQGNFDVANVTVTNPGHQRLYRKGALREITRPYKRPK